jgi:cytoskeleton protein RodZ
VLPGFLLRTARTERGLTLDEIATTSCIPLRVLVALEADDYARLPDMVYVRGYVRRCAGILGIAAQPLVEALDARYPGAGRDTGHVATGSRQSARPQRALLVAGAAVTLILGAGLVLALWRS